MKIFNRKARLEYHILETLEAGVVLAGAEVKMLRLGRADLNDSFARIQNGQALLKNLFIPAYQNADTREYNPRHDRKLLLHRPQIEYLAGKLSKGSMALIPLSLYFTRNYAKVELALAAVKRKVDKRRVIKERDELRKLERDIRGLKQ